MAVAVQPCRSRGRRDPCAPWRTANAQLPRANSQLSPPPVATSNPVKAGVRATRVPEWPWPFSLVGPAAVEIRVLRGELPTPNFQGPTPNSHLLQSQLP